MNTTKNSVCLITADTMRLIVANCSAAIGNNTSKLNDLNVFPVPDGDTGSNMALTISAAAHEIKNNSSDSVGEVAEIAAKAMLRGARGNSGVITSLLFRGFASKLKDFRECGAAELAAALQSGVAAAYKAVANPAEGTILTVARLAADAATGTTGTLSEVIDAAISEAKIALEQTMEINPVLKRAGVVDAGGCGWVLILEAIRDAINGDSIASLSSANDTISDAADFSDFDTEEINFTYCTEFIVSREGDKDSFALKSALEGLGDSLVFVEDDEIIKVHVHTNDPGTALHLAVAYGQFVTVKVENMRLQHSSKIAQGESAQSFASSAPAEKYGVVAVSPGDGITEIFTELGVDACVAGGQTMNPSTDDILAAIDKVNAENVFVLPNNKNIILAAEQAREISDKNVIVIPSRTVPQGICAMQFYDIDLELDDISAAMSEALSGITTMQMTTAVRDSDINGLDIKKDDFIALCEGELIAGGKNEAVLAELLIEKIKQTGRDIITIYYGIDVSEEEACALAAQFENAFTEDNVSLVPGAQSVYRYIISAEE